MLKMSRRTLFGGLGVMLAAPAIIRTPKLLMPLGRPLPQLMKPSLMLTIVDGMGKRWTVPVIDNKALFYGFSHASIIDNAVLSGTPVGDCDVRFNRSYTLAMSDSLHVTLGEITFG